MNLHLNSLVIRNFRCFSECDVTFQERLTVLIADNGRGKSTIMDAAALILAQFVDELTGGRQSDGIAKGDVRLARLEDNPAVPRTPSHLECSVNIDAVEVSWIRERRKFEKQTRRSPKSISGLLDAISTVKAGLLATDEELLLPVVAYYPSTRFSSSGYFGDRKHRKPPILIGRLDGYRGFLDPLSDSRHFNEWYEQKVAAVKKHAPTGAAREGSALQQLTAVRVAVNGVLEPTGWGQIDWDQTQQCVVAEHPVQGRLPLASLSSGVRNMVAMTADLAHRCARLNPALGEDAARRTTGIVLIDEVDLHLHPSWQQRVVGLLRDAFPCIQFILSTHSPQVLSTVHADCIRIVKLCDGDGQVETPQFQTRGVESADVLATIMNVDPVPRVEEAEWLNRYRALIEDGTHEGQDGLELRHRLTDHFGLQHPLMLDCDRLIRFSAFKRRAAGGS